MSIEEVFEVIRKGISITIKERYKAKTIKELTADILDKNNLSAVRYKKRDLEQEQSDNLANELRKEADDCSYNLEILNKVKSYFGKREIQGKVENFSILFIVLSMVNKSSDFVIEKEMFLKIFGMAIYNNNRIYEKRAKEKNKGLNSEDSFMRKETEAVINLKPYFNAKGEIIANDDIKTLFDNLNELFAPYFISIEIAKLIEDCNFNVPLFIEYIGKQLLIANSNRTYIENTLEESKVISKSERRQLVEQQRLNEQELATYFDGEKILRPCEDLEKFEILVNSCNLSEENKTRIITKMNTFLDKNNTLNEISFLSQEEQKIYRKAKEKQNGNIQIKNYIEEIYIFLGLLRENISSDDKEYIENEIRTIIKSLGFILNVNSLSLTL